MRLTVGVLRLDMKLMIHPTNLFYVVRINVGAKVYMSACTFWVPVKTEFFFSIRSRDGYYITSIMMYKCILGYVLDLLCVYNDFWSFELKNGIWTGSRKG